MGRKSDPVSGVSALPRSTDGSGDGETKSSFVADLAARGFLDLRTTEVWWSNHYDMLESHGYRLRPRFRPGWKGSWIGTGRDVMSCDDAYVHYIPNVIDATRISDGSVVAVKRVDRFNNCNEIFITTMLSKPDRLKDPMNHCVPTIDVFRDESEPMYDFMVMPLLRSFDDPEFFNVGEVVDFVHQTIEGLAYLHSSGVAHRDCTNQNIMMDGTTLYPDGFHPSWKERSADNPRTYAKHLRRSDVRSIKYYIIDFGISLLFNDPSARNLASGREGRDVDAPELNSGEPYDPFLVDVYTLGSVYRRSFLEKYHNVEFLKPLVKSMTEPNASDRPTSSEVLSQFLLIQRRLTRFHLRRRLRSEDEGIVVSLFLEFMRALYKASHSVASALRSLIHVPRRTISRYRINHVKSC